MRYAENPLLSYTFEVPFGAIKAEHVEPAVDTLLARARARLRELRESHGPRTYDNTLGVLDAATEELEHAMAVVGHLEAAANTPELREAYNAVQPKVSEFYANISLDGELYRALKEFAETPEARALEPARARFLKQTLEDFRRNGSELSPTDKTKVEQLSVELSRLTTQYSQQLLDATNAFEVVVTDPARLAGLPESAREAARESAAGRGVEGYRFTLQQPSYVAVLTYADDRALREQLYRAYNTRATVAPHDNRGLVAEIIKLRRDKAKLLGFDNFADLVLEDRMAKKGLKAQQFIAQLREATRPFFESENEQLLQFVNELQDKEQRPRTVQLDPWDVSYYSEKLRKERYDFDEEELRPYFSVDGVLAGMFTLVSHIYGVRVERRTNAPTYHPDVRYYSVLDEAGGEIGAFYADLYPREDKRGGAWMGDFITGLPGGHHKKHLGVMCANASPPTGGKPALLTHQDVETLFHEFGHLLHHLMGRANVRSLAGTRVAWDFVELPSMIMENFCWERTVLDFFARHYETDAPIPDALLEKLQRTRTFRAANMQMRQLGLASVDLQLHIDYDPARDGDVIHYARKIAQEHTPALLPEDFAMIAGFSHLFSSPVGYAAGYYSYKWAEVLEADAFSRFAEAGVLSREVGAAFCASVLSRGNEADPMELYTKFMGREPSQAALLKRAGLVAA
ncbi:MAG: oligopeptidase [Myxococcaceae bacterium]|nr:oligopeptidase [Myxococcaceae bacterium]